MFTLHKSTRKHKKYMAILSSSRKKVHFGDNRYQQFKDSTGLGIYSHLDHGDTRRKQLYYARHGKATEKFTPKWFSHKYLW